MGRWRVRWHESRAYVDSDEGRILVRELVRARNELGASLVEGHAAHRARVDVRDEVDARLDLPHDDLLVCPRRDEEHRVPEVKVCIKRARMTSHKYHADLNS